jgi:pimeloyl-ACP methyl ester carboxylesterase
LEKGMAILERGQDLGINYQVDGDAGTTWLLFNGATLPLEFWDPLIGVLAARDTVVRFDQRDAGATRAQGPFSLLDTAADAAALLEHLGLQSAVVVGHAWGGRVAQVFARHYPHLCDGLVICGTGGHVPATVSDESLTELREAGRAGDKDTWSRLVGQIYCAAGFAARQPDEFADLLSTMWPPSRRSARWDSRIAPSTSYWGLALLPTLLIYGAQDQFGTPENADDLQSRLADVRRLDIANAGHFVIREAAQQVVQALQDFALDLKLG